MFTGIVTAVGGLAESAGARRVFAAPPGWLADTRIGDSIAVNGACLTVTAVDGDRFECALSPETVSRIAPMAVGERVNLEAALKVGERLGGHFVTGHIDAVAAVQSVCEDSEGGAALELCLPPQLRQYAAEKGSITVAGVSLTVNSVGEESIALSIVPHTRQHTTLGELSVGQAVNVEVDLIARYLRRLVVENKLSASSTTD